MELVSHSDTETIHAGEVFGRKLEPGSIVCFKGGLGAGKTTFIKGVVHGACGSSPDIVSSPTFVYLNIYEGKKKIFHYDLYRLNDENEFIHMGLDEMLFEQGICCIEWSERIAKILPKDCIHVTLTHLEETKRHIKIEGNGIA